VRWRGKGVRKGGGRGGSRGNIRESSPLGGHRKKKLGQHCLKKKAKPMSSTTGGGLDREEGESPREGPEEIDSL